MGEEQTEPNAETHKIVWILGAGFSKPLGGPLLRDLFTEKASSQIQDAYLGTRVTSSVQHVTRIFEHGTKQKQWDNAEEYLERFDMAVRDDKTPRGLLLGWASRHDNVKTILDEKMLVERHWDGLQTMAAECCLFLKGIDPSMERFAAYRSWAKDFLAPSDSVLTFNYDRVVDLVVPRTRFRIPLPSEILDGSLPTPSPVPIVLKMHGSVDWVVENRKVVRKDDDPEAVLKCQTVEAMALATPGPRKQAMILREGVLAPIWRRAEEELSKADAIVIVGYSMPATDAQTRQWMIDQFRKAAESARGPLLDSMFGERNAVGRLPVHIVLGPDTRQSDVLRLKGLLKIIHPKIWPRVWPLGAQDFLGLVSRAEILRGPSVEEVHAGENG